MSKFKNNKNNKNNIKGNDIINKDNVIINKDNEQPINYIKKITNDINDKKIFIVNNQKKNKQYTDDDLFDINYNLIDKNFDLDDIEKKILKTSSKTSSKKNLDSNSLSRNRSSSLSSTNNNKELYKKIEDKNIYFNELLKKQLSGIHSDKKLNYNDIKRISKFIKTSIFDKKNCSLWNGYITNENNNSKGTYINFYFNKKKIALHRLLYINYIGYLSDNEYLKYSCENKGKCCNIFHMKKYTYINKNDSNKLKNSQDNNDINNDKNNDINNDKINYKNNDKNKSHNNNLSEPIQINIDKKKLVVEI